MLLVFVRLTDIARAAEIAHRGNARLVVDNTFASPCSMIRISAGIEDPADLIEDLKQALG